MTKLTHNLGAKILACFLVIIAGFAAVGSGIGAYYAYLNGFYGDNAKPYHESFLCRQVTSEYTWDVIDMVNVGMVKSEVESRFSPDRTNLRFTLQESSGNILLDTANLADTDEALFFVSESTHTLYNSYVTTTDGVSVITKLDTPATATIQCYITEPLKVSDHYENSFWFHQNLYDIHSILPPVFGISVLVFALCFVFLLCAAGHRAGKEEIMPNLQDKIPLDLYLCLVFPAAVTIGIYFLNSNPFNYMESIAIGIAGLLILSVLALATILTCTTRLKLGRYFYQNTICYKILRLCGRLFAWLWDALKAIPAMWKVAVAWLVISSVYIGGGFGAVILNLALTFVFCTIAAQLQKLAEGGEELAHGNLQNKIDTRRMFPPFRKHGEHLNSVSKGFSIALNQKMKSERLKTELITNVSHDIKTPLTSIINYVDLLKKEELTGQAAEYVEVLDRQSRRLKKLTEDLVEASKASTGNIKANLMPTDMGELVSQAVAEYEEKLELAKLEVIVNETEEPLYAMVDGNLTWRVLSNLLSNACKYSQTGTRVYIDLKKEENFVTVSMKNISKDALNIPVEELMERFVRGDSSRHTEGSGLGLNIAQSLVNLQKGKFTLEIEGDLFKAYMKFPGAEPPAPPEEKTESIAE